MDQVHVKSSRSTSRSNPAKMACEKASKRLRTILVKASRLGVSTTEVAKLASAKKLIPQRDHGWKLAVFLLVMFGGGVIVALACTARKGCSKLEEIVSSISNIFLLSLLIDIKSIDSSMGFLE
ncbi:hypothetical protein APICC_07312 [Apis cerana cerana]|uniref:Transmembrane protein n=1 Tax=Apis cerana cerana TaxID=94128 RepID=A0A2A3ENR5_APICC|nr:hypothetical protein APICC_07312 [Apis cerana cerana]